MATITRGKHESTHVRSRATDRMTVADQGRDLIGDALPPPAREEDAA